MLVGTQKVTPVPGMMKQLISILADNRHARHFYNIVYTLKFSLSADKSLLENCSLIPSGVQESDITLIFCITLMFVNIVTPYGSSKLVIPYITKL